MIKVWLAAPGLALRIGLRALLQEMDGIEIAAESGQLPAPGGDWADLAGEAAPVVLVCGPLALSEWAAGQELLPAILLLSDEPPPGQLAALARAPAWGLLTSDAGPEELAAALRALAQGLVVANPLLLSAWQPKPDAPAAPSGAEALTPREREVLQALAQGLANKQISLLLGISEHTVKFHISAIYHKLGAANRTEAVRLGVQGGMLSL